MSAGKDPSERQRLLRRALIATAIAAPLVAVLSFLILPPRPEMTLRAEIDAVTDAPSGAVELTLRLPGGEAITLEALPGDAPPEPGTELCLLQSQHPLTRQISYRPVPDASCDEGL